MSYTINGIVQNISTGMISGYFGSSTTDPSGWVIADGASRQYSTIYDGLISLGIGSNVDSIYTPPNLNAVFLRGTGTSDVSSSYVGPELNNFADSTYITHKHTASQAAHTHELKGVWNNTEYAITGGGVNNGGKPGGSTGTAANPRFGLFAQNGIQTINGFDNLLTQLDMINRFQLTISDARPSVNFSRSITGGLGNANETRPYNISTVWIIKL
jgi:hypothetical protein